MKEIKFRPLRRIGKTGKIAVASYAQWRKVMTADYNEFVLVLDEEYKRLPSEEYVCNHIGENLFFFTYNPGNVPVFQYNKLMGLDAIRDIHSHYGIRWNPDSHTNYNAMGMDCDGVPTFSHHTANHIATFYRDETQFEPLTVKTVVMWLGWFLWQLNNSTLKSKTKGQ